MTLLASPLCNVQMITLKPLGSVSLSSTLKLALLLSTTKRGVTGVRSTPLSLPASFGKTLERSSTRSNRHRNIEHFHSDFIFLYMPFRSHSCWCVTTAFRIPIWCEVCWLEVTVTFRLLALYVSWVPVTTEHGSRLRYGTLETNIPLLWLWHIEDATWTFYQAVEVGLVSSLVLHCILHKVRFCGPAHMPENWWDTDHLQWEAV